MNSKAHFVTFKTLMSIFVRFEYSTAYFLFIKFILELQKVYLNQERMEKKHLTIQFLSDIINFCLPRYVMYM